ncbi:glycogen synthase [Spirochaeta isovalerica]|uniref:Glycogen synthase n=1 Tax=Spirochaeta isovalerica TaxID=150 RepID=A0A841R6L4_9SPIO|nr:glycogen/starch synthase [Spirochaeta isovalerica]MBB6478680.1 starch synthase [Spirochaeta isovalerica]
MSESRKILMVSSEAVPYAKTGGLADMVSALALHLRESGDDVRIVIPRYYSIDKSKLEKINGPLGVPTGTDEKWTAVYKDMLKGKVPIYFIDYDQLYGRAGIYGPSGSESFEDNAERFNLLSRASFQLCRMLGWYPDVMHCHDWSAGLIPIYLNTTEFAGDFSQTASVFTIHNIGYQGVFPAEETIHTGLVETAAMLHKDNMNFLKCAIDQSHVITTVSPTYAKEIQTEQYGEGLEHLLDYRKYDLYGILNGVDYNDWNPETDPFIAPDNYSKEDMANKKKLKALLQEEAGLEVTDKKPLIGIVSRLADQKGFRELCEPFYGCLASLCRYIDLQFVILGTGEKWCEEELSRLNSTLPNLHAWTEFDNRKAHLIEAGSDFFLMPSRYEPCGLNQLYSLKYGTLPIVRMTGGLADTVENYNQQTGNGTGFTFYDLTPEAIYNVVGWAVWAWYNKKDHIEKMRQKAMSRDFSWNEPVKEYRKVYDIAMTKRRS